MCIRDSSWTLRKFSRLSPSGEVSVKKVRVRCSCSESPIQLCHNTTPNLELKLAKTICSENYILVWKCASTKSIYREKYPESWTRKKRAQDSETQSSVGLRHRCPENWTKNRAGLTDLHPTNFTKEHKSIIISPLRSYWYWISLVLVIVFYLVFRPTFKEIWKSKLRGLFTRRLLLLLF